MNTNKSGKFLDSELAALEISANNFAARFIPDARVRMRYISETSKFAQSLKEKVAAGQLSEEIAAQQAQQMRNTIMNAMRGQTSDFGYAISQFMKNEGKSLVELEEKYAKNIYQKDFQSLLPPERQRVWIRIVEKSGQPQKIASIGARTMGYAGRGLFALTAVIAVYHIASAENKTKASVRELSAVGGGFMGSAAFGAAGGMLCGPAAIACVPIGIFVGGILGAMSADSLFYAIWK